MRLLFLTLLAVAAPLGNALSAQALRSYPGLDIAARAPAPPPPECPDTSYRAAVGRTLVLPPTDVPRAMRGQSYLVQFRVNAAAVIDSVEISGPRIDRGYLGQWQKAVRRQKYLPALCRGLAITSWTSYQVTLEPSAPQDR